MHAMPTDSLLNGPIRLQTTLKKRRVGESEPYATIIEESWHEQDGSEIADQQRIDELNQRQQAAERTDD